MERSHSVHTERVEHPTLRTRSSHHSPPLSKPMGIDSHANTLGIKTFRSPKTEWLG